jgi:hypothetical protein
LEQSSNSRTISPGKTGEFGGSLNDIFRVSGHVSLKDEASEAAPEHIPENIRDAFAEGASCLAMRCHNAAGAMFRLCVDLATRQLVPDPDKLPAEIKPPNEKQRRDLGLRLRWLFENGFLPADVKDLSHCIKEDGNDGAHTGLLTQADAEDLVDFTRLLLERLYTDPKRIELAALRRETRRGKTPAQ